MAHVPHSLEYTALLGNKVFHYTCNSPDQKVLDSSGIKAIGGELGCKDPREVLIIPTKVYDRFGLSFDGNDLKSVSEALLRILDE